MNLQAWWTVFFCALLIWHVDGFVAISGWFGIRFSWRKLVTLYGVILFYSLLGIVLQRIVEPESFGLRSALNVSGGWFGGSYLMLMLLAPVLTAAVKQLASEGRKRLVMALSLVIFGMFCAWAPRHLFTAIDPSSVGTCTFFGMVFVYLIARTCRELFPTPIPLKRLLLAGLLFPVGISLCACVGVLARWSVTGSALNALATYHAPHVWLFAIVLLMMFLWHVRVPGWLSKVCRYVGPSTFGIYLIHDVMPLGRHLYCIPERYLYESLGWHPTACIVLSAVVTFVVCLLIDSVRRLLVVGLKAKAEPWLRRVDAKWEALLN